MKSTKALREFEQHLLRCGVRGTPKAPDVGFAHMLGFYRSVRATDVSLDADGDMLSFQWGTYDWGHGPHFEVDLTRQFIRSGAEDDDIWQLQLTYRFTPTELTSGLGKGDRWCRGPDELSAFERFVFQHPVLEALGSSEDGRVELRHECAG